MKKLNLVVLYDIARHEYDLQEKKHGELCPTISYVSIKQGCFAYKWGTFARHKTTKVTLYEVEAV